MQELSTQANSRSLSNYAQAFIKWSNVTADHFKIIRPEGTHSYIEFNSQTYQVSTAEDIIMDYKEYFERGDFDELYLQTHEGVWSEMARDLGLTSSAWITAIYRQWRAYWQQVKHVKNEAWKKELIEHSWRDLQILIEVIKEDPHNMVEYAVELDQNLVVMFVLVIHESHQDKQFFFSDAVDYLLENGLHWITAGETFAEVELELEKGENTSFYIYEADLDYYLIEEELKKEATERATKTNKKPTK